MKYFIIGLLILLTVALNRFYPQLMTVNDNHLFWLSSTIAQGFIALVSLLGMVGIFKLQYISNERERLTDSMREALGFYVNKTVCTYTPQQIVDSAKDVMSKNTGGGWITAMQKVIPCIENSFTDEKNIKGKIISFVIFTLILVGITLLSLALTPLIIQYSLGISVLGILLILSAYSLFLAIRLVKSML
ncbi:MAG: hypothetical protein HZA49_03605 [Planctomycetes bacterium]|nr:hypothetical protein [Planctomycetota bacterium]